MRRYFVFFANPLQQTHHIRDVNYNFVGIDDNIRKFLAECSRSMPTTAKVFANDPNVTAIFYRNEIVDASDAFEQAYGCVSGLLDTFALFTFEAPKLLPIVILMGEGDERAAIKSFEFQKTGKAFIGDITTKFSDHSTFFLKRFLNAFDVAAGTDAEAQSELALRLRTLAKMYRHGRAAHDYQVQYLCKFTAVEGIVCGSRTRLHARLLKERLPALFKERLSASRVEQLWQLRCRASHEGVGKWNEFIAAIPDIDLIAVGCGVFVVDHLEKLNTIEELWHQAHSYKLPDQLFTDVWSFNAVQSMFGDVGWLDPKLFQWEKMFNIEERAAE